MGKSETVTVTVTKVGTSFYGLDVNPLAGQAPLAVTIITQLRRDDTGLGVSGKTVNLYRNGAAIKSTTTVSTSGGPGFCVFQDTLTATGEHQYYVYFAGDSEFEGCEASDGSTVIDGEPPNGEKPPVTGAGLGLLLLALLVVSQE